MSITVTSQQVASGQSTIITGQVSADNGASFPTTLTVFIDKRGSKEAGQDPQYAQYLVQTDVNGAWSVNTAEDTPAYSNNWDGLNLSSGIYEVGVHMNSEPYDVDYSRYELVVYDADTGFADPTIEQLKQPGWPPELEPVLTGVASTSSAVTTKVTVTDGDTYAVYEVTPDQGSNVWRLDLRTAQPIDQNGELDLEGQFTASITSSDGQTSLSATTEILVSDAPVAPTFNADTISDGETPVISGTADPNPWFETWVTVNIKDSNGHYQGVAEYKVDVDAEGNWTINLAETVPDFRYRDSFEAGDYVITIYTAGEPGQSYYSGENDLTLLYTVDVPERSVSITVDEVEFTAGDTVILKGTADSSVGSLLITVIGDGDEVVVRGGKAVVGKDGSWSFDLTAWLQGESLDAGKYEVIAETTVGKDRISDKTKLELTITADGPSGPTENDDNLAGTPDADTIDLLAGDDVYAGGDGGDTITGGAGLDTLKGEGGDDSFIVNQGDLVDGETYDGGEGDDTLVLAGGGAFDLTGVTLISIEGIVLDDGKGSDLTVSDFIQASLISSAAGARDVVRIADAAHGLDAVATLMQLFRNGVEEVRFTDEDGKALSFTLDKAGAAIGRNEEGGIEQKIADAKNGVQTITDYEAGKTVSITQIDAAGVAAWKTIVTEYEADGKTVAKRTQTNDNGSETVTNYEGGKATDSTTTYANGTQIVTDYENGVRKTVTQTDNSQGGSVVTWASIVTEYESDGKTVAKRTQTNDNGSETVTNYEDGKVTDSTTTAANGVETVTEYENGVRKTVTQTDNSQGGSAVIWASIVTEYESDGKTVAKRTQTNDNGSETVTNYEDSKVTDSTTTAANGVETITEYENGVRKTVTQTDNSQGGSAAKWTSIVTEYGDDGKTLVQRTQVDDNGNQTVHSYSAGVLTATILTRTDGSMVVTGGKGNDQLAGGSHNDSINGGFGNDIMTGNSGNDVFVFSKGGFGNDTITDFANGEDKINLRAFGVAGSDAYDANPATNDDFARLGFTATQTGNDLVLDLGQNGTITLQNFDVASLDASDFV